ncbi:MAG: isocitrate lyase/phosphoenolpyruvate mutase family protein [Opitutaceae bacterium]
MNNDVTSRAATFHRLHQGGLLLLANAWDAGSARLIESLGAPAIATTSAAVAWSHGYPDGDHLPIRVLTATIAEITRVIRVPLSVDFEGGYSSDPAIVAENVAQLIDAGAVGINLEDGNGTAALCCAKIDQVKRTAARLGVKLFINARIDVYLHALVPAEHRLEETVARAARYRAAGVDGIFVPGVVDAPTIKTLVAEVKLPLNVLARSGLPSAPELAALGVRRLSAGSGLASASYGRITTLATDFLKNGVSASLAEGALTYAGLNTLMGSR